MTDQKEVGRVSERRRGSTVEADDQKQLLIPDAENAEQSHSSMVEPPSISTLPRRSGRTSSIKIALFKKRYLVLAMFSLEAVVVQFQWVQYAIITDSVAFFYSTSPLAVNATSMIYMLAYVVLALPARWLLKRSGFRCCVLLAASLTVGGSWVKCASVQRDMFLLGILGQSLVSAASVLLIGLPTQLALMWFGPGELGWACNVGMSGSQVGVGLGFFVPPLLVPAGRDPQRIAAGLSTMFYIIAGVATLLLVLILLGFEDSPPLPPSHAQAFIEPISSTNYIRNVRRILKFRPYVWLLLSYGFNVGVFYAFSTLLNQMVQPYFPDLGTKLGWLGLGFIAAGIAGSLVLSAAMHRIRMFREMTVAVYIVSLLIFVAFAVCLHLRLYWVTFFAAALLGFLMAGYHPVGYQFAAELTYPESEEAASGLLNDSGQIIGLLVTLMACVIMEVWGEVASTCSMLGVLLLGAITTVFAKPYPKRTSDNAEEYSEFSIEDLTLRKSIPTENV